MKKVRRKMAPQAVPIDLKGNVVRSTKEGSGVINGKDTFVAALALHKTWKHGSAQRILMVDTTSGKTYPMFLGDFLEMTKDVTMINGEILGEWAYCKKSRYYGVYLIQELENE